MPRPLFDDGLTSTITTPIGGKVGNIFSLKPAAASLPQKSKSDSAKLPDKSNPEKSKKRPREEGQDEEEIKPTPKGILKNPNGSSEGVQKSAPEASTENKPLSNRERKKREKAAAWAARIAQREAQKASTSASPDAVGSPVSKPAAGSPGPKPTAAPAPQKPAEMTDIEFLARKRARREAGSGVAIANEKKRRKKEDAFPLLNGAPAPRVLTPQPPKKEAAKDLPKQEAKADCPAGPQVHTAQLKAQAAVLAKTRQQLPIYPHADSLRQRLRERDVLVMLGETGSGKSTQIGQFLVDEPWRNGKCIAITQPRRVAAVNLARRVAAEMGVRLGEEVGYSVRFDNKSSEKTRIKFLTDGMLLQEMLADPKLKRYSCVVVDEAHERTVGTDLVMGFLRALVYGERRGNLKVVIMSATLEVEAMARFFEENRGEGIEITGIREQETPTETIKQEAEESAEPEVRSNSEEPDKKKKKKKKKKKGGIDTMSLIRSPSPVPECIKSPETIESEATMLQTAQGQMGHFGSVALFHVPGRQYPVEAFHSQEPVEDYVEAALKTVFTIHYSEPLPGDILVFLTGQEEIENLRKTILEYAANLPREQPKMHVLPLYAALPFAQQNKVFLPAPEKRMRKVILCTNIAETSVTVPGVRFVIDCGKAKLKQFRPKLGLESLLVTPISQSSALQRRGRAGREGPGKCYHLYTQEAFDSLKEATKPEILRTDVSNAILTLKARGHDDIVNFDYLSPPKLESLQKALEQLYALGALGNDGKITALGRKMAKLPLAPPLARALIAASESDLNVLPEVVDIVAALSADNLFPPPADEEIREKMEEARKSFRRQEGDHIMLLELVRAFDASGDSVKAWCEAHYISHPAMKNVLDIRAQLRTYCSSLPGAKDWDANKGEAAVSPDLAERVLKAFLKGYFHQTARAAPDGREYVTVLGHQSVAIHPASILFGARREAIVYHEYVFTTRPFARWCSAVQLDWVAEAAPGWVRGSV